MEKGRSIDSIRQRGGQINIGTPEDGAILEMINLNGRIFAIKERSVYELLQADDIDPQRVNPQIPRMTQRLIVKLGTESEILSRTFLAAKTILRKEYLPSIDVDKALTLTLELVQELNALSLEIREYQNEEKLAKDNYEKIKIKKLDHAIPSIPDIVTRCKTIFQKADHVLQSQLDIIRLFYPDFDKTSFYKSLAEFLESKFGNGDEFVKFINQVNDFIYEVRNARNCSDHRRTELTVKDFDMQPDSNIITPTIEMNFNGSKIDRFPLYEYLNGLQENLLLVFENLLAYLTAKSIQPMGKISASVGEIPEAERRNKYIKFAIWLPLPPSGFFQQ